MAAMEMRGAATRALRAASRVASIVAVVWWRGGWAVVVVEVELDAVRGCSVREQTRKMPKFGRDFTLARMDAVEVDWKTMEAITVLIRSSHDHIIATLRTGSSNL